MAVIDPEQYIENIVQRIEALQYKCREGEYSNLVSRKEVKEVYYQLENLVPSELRVTMKEMGNGSLMQANDQITAMEKFFKKKSSQVFWQGVQLVFQILLLFSFIAMLLNLGAPDIARFFLLSSFVLLLLIIIVGFLAGNGKQTLGVLVASAGTGALIGYGLSKRK